MTTISLVFSLFAAASVIFALLLLWVRNIVHAAFLFFALLFAIAGLFVLGGADFLGVSQVVVYIGGILILVLFGIMLTRSGLDEKPVTAIIQPVAGIAVGVLLAGALFYVWQKGNWQGNTPLPQQSLRNTGIALLTDFLLPFEIISVILLAALIGAASIARRKN